MERERDQLAAWAREEREKLRELSLPAAAEYIWDYYKLWIIGIVSAVSLVIYMAVHLAGGLQTYRFYITYAGTQAEVGNSSDLYRAYSERTAGQAEEGTVEFNAAAYFDYARDQGRGNKYYDVFVAYIDAGVLDAVTMPRDALEQFGATGRLLDLDSEACATIRAKYGDRFVYCLPLDEAYSDQPVAVGIDVSDTCLMTQYALYPAERGCVLGIAAQSAHIGAVEAYLDLIFEGVE